MKRGFTLLELIVVIIILGVLATLGFTQYGKMVERSRGAEAKAILGSIRTYAAAYRVERGTTVGFSNTLANIGTAADQIPSACRASHYFRYAITSATSTTVGITATRCTGATGKQPGGTSAGTLTLTSNLSTGTDTWGGTGGY